MKKAELSQLFRSRIKQLLSAEDQSVAQFLRDAGIDRSALSQFLDPGSDRLPRAEALRRIAEARGVSVDWLLGLENAPDGRQQITPSLMIEKARGEGDATPIEAWRREAAGLKLRYVPSLLPDMLLTRSEEEGAHGGAGESLLGDAGLEDTDVEIAMPIQTLEQLAEGTGHWRDVPAAERRQQLAHMACMTAWHYPTLRLHLFDARATFAPAFSVFGKSRVAFFLGESYLVLTGPEDIRTFTRLFNGLVRASVIGPDRADKTLSALADTVAG